MINSDSVQCCVLWLRCKRVLCFDEKVKFVLFSVKTREKLDFTLVFVSCCVHQPSQLVALSCCQTPSRILSAHLNRSEFCEEGLTSLARGHSKLECGARVVSLFIREAYAHAVSLARHTGSWENEEKLKVLAHCFLRSLCPFKRSHTYHVILVCSTRYLGTADDAARVVFWCLVFWHVQVPAVAFVKGSLALRDTRRSPVGVLEVEGLRRCLCMRLVRFGVLWTKKVAFVRLNHK
jgi:hypothetical protein